MFLFLGKRGIDSLKLFKVCVLGTFSPRFRFSSSFRIEYNFRWNCKYLYRVLHEKCYRNMSGYSAFAPTSAHSFFRACCMHSSFTVRQQFLDRKRSCFWKLVAKWTFFGRIASNYCYFVVRTILLPPNLLVYLAIESLSILQHMFHPYFYRKYTGSFVLFKDSWALALFCHWMWLSYYFEVHRVFLQQIPLLLQMILVLHQFLDNCLHILQH